MKQLLTDINARLGEAPFPAGLTPVRKNNRLFEYVDIDWAQVDFYGDFPPPVKFPCALVDISSASYTNEGGLYQMGIVEIQVRIVELVLSNSSYRAPDGQKERAQRVFDLVSETNRLLHGWTGSPQLYGPLTKVSLQKVNRRDGLKEYRLTYRVQLVDDSAVPVRAMKTIKPVVVAQMQTT